MSRRSNGSRGEKRERILQAALEVCRRDGVARARMEEVAARARVSKGTLYRFFESKEDLFLATVIGSYEESTRILGDREEPGGSSRERLENLLDGLTKVLENVAPKMTVHYQAWGLVANDPARRSRLYGFLRDFHLDRGARIAQTVLEGQREGLFAPDSDAQVFADGIMALVGGFLYRATFDPERASAERLRRCFDALIRDSLLVDGCPPEGPEPRGH